MSSSSSSSLHCWTAPDAPIDCVCVGTGRFLRAVLVPALTQSGYRPALIQPRGRTLLDSLLLLQSDDAEAACASDGAITYPVDTVLATGEVETTNVPIYGAFSLGAAEDRKALFDWLGTYQFSSNDNGGIPRILGVGVTEAGLSGPDTSAMKDLYEVLRCFCTTYTSRTSSRAADSSPRMSVINTDNVPFNGDVIMSHMRHIAQSRNDDSIVQFLSDRVCFHNSMVDRITSHRPNDPLVPRAEPMPAKALVVLDPLGLLDPLSGVPGVVLRQSPQELENDIELKLRVANGTHTALAHVLALLGITLTNHVVSFPATDMTVPGQQPSNAESSPLELLVQYLDALVEGAVVPAWVSASDAESRGPERDRAVRDAWDDWRRRLWHPTFGLSSYFITQNGPAKGGIRLGPTVRDLLMMTTTSKIPVTMAYAFAALLRWLTPRRSEMSAGVYRGWLQPSRLLLSRTVPAESHDVEYADGLRYNQAEGWYEFRCACTVSRSSDNDDPVVLSDWLASLTQQPQQPLVYSDAIRAYLLAAEGGNLADVAAKRPAEMDTLVKATATLYARMVAGDDLLELLGEMKAKQGSYYEGMETPCSALVDEDSIDGGRPLHYRETPIPDSSGLHRARLSEATVRAIVASEVASVQVIDLHTHLLPPSHGALCLWGVDELLTYHYLVAEYFMIAPADLSPEDFYALTKRQQANLIWDSLFVQRSPVSEACRGVVTTLVRLGLQAHVDNRDLDSIRAWYRRSFPSEQESGADTFSAHVHSLAGVRYNIMTNIPFNPDEAKYWRENMSYCSNYRSALRVDPLLMGDTATIEQALAISGYACTLDGARRYLRDWCDIMKPEYLMASTPHDFTFGDEVIGSRRTVSINEDAMRKPGAFAVVASASTSCCPETQEESPSLINESSEFLSEVLMKVCEERDLPIALKIGAHRGVNPNLQAAGDGVVAFADASVLARLCTRYPNVRFLVTFLSLNNQHEACVLASKFRNLHLYGCWWFCNNPSIIQTITKMRVEMLGTSFTAQHSDARVLDQLVYKWAHARSAIAEVLQEEYLKLLRSGWSMIRGEVRRDVERLFGKSYEEFMQKSLLTVNSRAV